MLKDESGKGWDATIQGGDSELVDGVYEKAICLQLANAEVDGNIIESTGNTGEISLMCWFRMDEHANFDCLICIETPQTADCCEYRLMVNPSSNPYWNAGIHADKSLVQNGVSF